jgi:translation initiation factor 2B subunit (eIF-2B alpha/beta/delta family)
VRGWGSELDTAIRAIAADHQSGATTLATEAIQILRAAARLDRAALVEIVRALCAAQPTMANIWNAASVALQDEAQTRLEIFAERLRHAPRALGRFASDLLLRDVDRSSDPLRIVTYSSSSSVLACLAAAAAQRPLVVACAEGRPLFEGRRMAAALVERGIATELFTDAAVASTLGEAMAVLVGADAVTTGWFINKCGTYGLAAAAQHRGVAVYVAASRDKFAGRAIADRLRLSAGPAGEVWDRVSPGVVVANPYFERVPIDLAAGFITDVGMISAADVRDVCTAVSREVNDAMLVGVLGDEF